MPLAHQESVAEVNLHEVKGCWPQSWKFEKHGSYHAWHNKTGGDVHEGVRNKAIVGAFTKDS